MTLIVLTITLAAALYVWHGQRLRRLADARLAGIRGPAVGQEAAEEPRRRIQTFPRRYRWLPPAVGVASALALWIVVHLPIEIAVAAACLIGVMVQLLEQHRGEQQEAIIEQQLATAIYLMVGSLRAGSSLLSAFESALEEIGPPLRPYFQEVAGRIKLGDDPKTCVTDLQVHVPLETFRLFATSLAIHWEVGGSLATTLSTVGQTVRDRIELSRRVRAQAVESNASVAVVLAIAYALGILMWRVNPDRLNAFVGSSIGTMVIALVIALQAVGLVWMSRLSKTGF